MIARRRCSVRWSGGPIRHELPGGRCSVRFDCSVGLHGSVRHLWIDWMVRMDTPSTGGGRVWISPPKLVEAARRVEELLRMLERLDPSELVPVSDAVVGHAELARALAESGPAWGRALRAMTADIARIIEELGPNATTTQRVDQAMADELTRTAARLVPRSADRGLAGGGGTAIGTYGRSFIDPASGTHAEHPGRDHHRHGAGRE
jgi:hypothetical protein